LRGFEEGERRGESRNVKRGEGAGSWRWHSALCAKATGVTTRVTSSSRSVRSWRCVLGMRVGMIRNRRRRVRTRVIIDMCSVMYRVLRVLRMRGKVVERLRLRGM